MAPSSFAQATASTLSRSSPWLGQDLAIGGEELHEGGFFQPAGKKRRLRRHPLPRAQARERQQLMHGPQAAATVVQVLVLRSLPPPRGPHDAAAAAVRPSRPPPPRPTHASSTDPTKEGPDPNSMAPDLAIVTGLRLSCFGLVGAPTI
ncbi:hypothetical protein OsJ_10308 [Oryza sativa Japonica Group]|uniref:Uncharacterized protein n=3 Tax=Oryza TaxID=4527 RepID=A0A8J8XL40_ORYSJ|nr:hypothetical protein LOC_Os03g16560 [Oryza sativa Japonica Group]EEE58781.1 hypothetical protein OsJ_10308 [Oryza sativa Japonica Group]